METLKVSIMADEYEALSQMAEHEVRSVPGQARYLIRLALIESGRLKQTAPNTDRERD